MSAVINFLRLFNLQMRHVYPAHNRCIYCGRQNVFLATDHILPAGLLGRHEIPKASCKNCEKTTCGLEQKLLRGPLWPLRVKLGMHSGRRKGEQPKDFDKRFFKGKAEQLLRLPIESYPSTISVPVFNTPGYLTQKEWLPDTSFEAIDVLSIDNADPIEVLNQTLKKTGMDTIDISVTIDPTLLRREIAKILHGFAVARLPSAFTPRLVPFILGKEKERAAYYVGSKGPLLPEEHFSRLGGTHAALHFIFNGTDNIEVVGVLVLRSLNIRDAYLAALGTLPSSFRQEIEALRLQRRI